MLIIMVLTGTHFGANTPLFLGYPSLSIIVENERERQTYTECHKVTKTKKREYITPILRPLHWLPVTYRTEFKVWLAEYKLVRFLRSAGAVQLVVPRVEAKQGEMAFSRYAAHCWNQLPMGIRSAPTLTCFKKKIKTALFFTAFNESVGFTCTIGSWQYLHRICTFI